MSSNTLPIDYPHREALIAGGVVTRAQVRAAGDSKLNKLADIGPAGVKAIRAYEAAHPEEIQPAQPDEAEQRVRAVAEARERAMADEAARKEAEVAAQKKAEAEARQSTEEAARRAAAEAEARRREEEEQLRAQERPRRVRVKVENLGPTLLKKGNVTSDPKIVALLDKPYGHKLVEEVD